MAKKSFINNENPALQFISNVPEEEPKAPKIPVEQMLTEVPDEYKPDFRITRKEKKSRRLNLVIKPSVYEKTKEKADLLGVSVNDYISQVLEQAL